jgi:anti-sigma regulatory factor (Ser/Thr protein kinase)
MSSDEITLTMPRERDFFRVAHLVLGGLAVRLDLTFENLEDLQLALAELLQEADDESAVTVSVRVEGDTIETVVGPFERAALAADLEREAADGVGLRRVLETVCDRMEISERDGAQWVTLTKTVRLARHEG